MLFPAEYLYPALKICQTHLPETDINFLIFHNRHSLLSLAKIIIQDPDVFLKLHDHVLPYLDPDGRLAR